MLIKKIKIIFVIVLMLFFLQLSPTFATFRNRYNGSGEISTAIWSVTLNQSNDNHLSIIPSPNESVASYSVNVTSVSEVDVLYSIVVDNLPANVSVDLDGGGYQPADNNNKVIFSNITPIYYNDSNKTRVHTLTFKALNGATVSSNNEVDIDVKVKQQA